MSREVSEIHIKLEAFIKKYYYNQIVRGILIFSILALLLYLILVFTEFLGHFSTLIRTILFFSTLLLLILVFIWGLIKPSLAYFKITSSLTPHQANSILQKHFPELKDQLKNILELETMPSSSYSESLIQKAIQQKSENIRLIPFTQAVKLKANYKYIKLLSVSVVVLILLYLFSPQILAEGTERILHYDTFYEKASNFTFVIDNDTLSVQRGNNLTLQIHTEGYYVPYPIYIKYGGVEYLMQKESENVFTYEFKTINQSFQFYLQAEDYQSRPLDITVLPTPELINFNINIKPPKYTKIPDIQLKNNGDFLVPEGSEIEWQFKTKDIDNLWLKIGDSIHYAEQQSSNNFTNKILLKADMTYSIGVSNRLFNKPEILQFSAQIIRDEYPSIMVQSISDSLNPSVFYFRGQVNDDYGIKKIRFCYHSEQGTTPTLIDIPIDKGDALQDFYYAFNFKEVAKQGEQLFYYFEVWDNDEINGSKQSKTQEFQFYLPSREELDKLESESAKSIQDKLAQTQELAKDLQKDVKNLKKDLIDKEANSWQRNKKLAQIADKQTQLEKLMKEVAKENQQTNELLKNLSKEDEDLLKKQEQIEDLLSQLMDEEMKKLMEEINKLMEEFDKDEFNELSKEMEMSYEDLSEQLDRNLEQLKRFEVEKKMLKTISDLEQLAQEHQKLSEQTKEAKQSQENLQQQQAEHQKKMDKIANDIQQTMQKNKALKEPLNLQDMTPSMQNTQESMKNTSESLQKGKNSKASKQQQKTAEQMQQMAQQMQQMMNQASQQQQTQDMASLKQILENLNTFSFEQEDIMLQFNGLKYKDPKYIYLFNKQTKEKENFNLIKDSLYALALTQPMLASPINKELLQIERELNKTEEALDNRHARTAQASQQMVMMSANNLSLLLSEILDQMQKQQSQSQCQKSGNCKNPNGSKPKSGFGQAKQQAQSMKQQMQNMLEQLKNGKGKGTKSGKKKTKGQLGKMIAEQEKMQKMLSDLANKQGLSPENAKKLKEIKKLSEQIEDDLIQQNITPTTLKRQELILTRLLEAENSEFKRDKDQQRESNTVKYQKISNPKDVFKTREEQLVGDDILIKNKVKLQPFYKKKYKNYLINLNN